jgi:hypothetical protein
MANQQSIFTQPSENRGPTRLAMATTNPRDRIKRYIAIWLTLENILILVFFFVFFYILSLEEPHHSLMLFINGLILVAMGCALSYSKIKEILLIYRSPASRIYTIPTTGHFEIAGQAQGNPIISPIAEAPCVFWQAEVIERQGRYWVSIYQDVSRTPFEMIDDTGKVTIHPDHAKFILANSTEESSGSFSHLSDRTLAKLQQINLKTKGVLGFDRSLKVYERLIKPDQPMHALGKIQELDKMASFADRMAFSIISDRGKGDLLKKLYWQVAARLGLALLIGGWLTAATLYH